MRELLLASLTVALLGCTTPDPEIEAVTALGATAQACELTAPCDVRYRIDSIVTGANGTTVQLAYAFDDPRVFFHTDMLQEDPDHFAATIPGQPVGTKVFYLVQVLDEDTGEQLAIAPSGIASSYLFEVVAGDQ